MRRFESVWARSAIVAVLGAGTTIVGMTRTAATTSTGFLEVCKEYDLTGPAFTGTFSFSIAGRPGVIQAAVGSCAGLVELPTGEVSITEVPSAGFDLTGFRAEPFSRGVGFDLPSRTATVIVVPGDTSTQTIAFFKNRPSGVIPGDPPLDPTPPPPGGRIKICKIAGPGVAVGTVFTYEYAGGFLTVPAGPASQGGYCTFNGVLPLDQVVTIVEQLPAGVKVSGVKVDPAERQVGLPDLAGASVTMRVGPEINEVTFTNEVPQPTTTTSSTSSMSSTSTTVPTSTTSSSTSTTLVPRTSSTSTTVPATDISSTTGEIPFVAQTVPGGPSLARTGGDPVRLVFQAGMAIAIGATFVTATRIRRRERLMAFEQWLDQAAYADLLEFARGVARPRPAARPWRRSPRPGGFSEPGGG